MQATSEQRVSEVPCTPALEPSKLVQTTSENDRRRKSRSGLYLGFLFHCAQDPISPYTRLLSDRMAREKRF